MASNDNKYYTQPDISVKNFLKNGYPAENNSISYEDRINKLAKKDLATDRKNKNTITRTPTAGYKKYLDYRDYREDGGTNVDYLEFEQLKPDTHAYNLRTRSELYNKSENPYFRKTFRYGTIDPYGAISTGREFLFFTRPNLRIHQNLRGIGSIYNNPTGEYSKLLYSPLRNIPFWMELMNTSENTIIWSLESDYQTKKEKSNNVVNDPFNHLLQNRVISNLDVSSLDAETIDTPTNMYGVGFKYRGSSEGSDDNPTFSLEFKDDRWLNTYKFFKAYEEYETLKHHGVIAPYTDFIVNKVIHDQFSIYKFIVDEDMETIIYYGKMYGVMPTSLPRDTFSSPTFDNGISYNINFQAAFYEDMKPDILADFNALSRPLYSTLPYDISYGAGYVDTRPAVAAYVEMEEVGIGNGKKHSTIKYKLKWRTDSKDI